MRPSKDQVSLVALVLLILLVLRYDREFNVYLLLLSVADDGERYGIPFVKVKNSGLQFARSCDRLTVNCRDHVAACGNSLTLIHDLELLSLNARARCCTTWLDRLNNNTFFRKVEVVAYCLRVV